MAKHALLIGKDNEVLFGLIKTSVENQANRIKFGYSLLYIED